MVSLVPGLQRKRTNTTTAVALTSLSKYRQTRNAVETVDDCATELWQ